MVERILEENIATESGNGGSSYDNSNSIDNINNNIDTTAVAECNDGGNSIIAANANEPDKNNCNQLAGKHSRFFFQNYFQNANKQKKKGMKDSNFLSNVISNYEMEI